MTTADTHGRAADGRTVTGLGCVGAVERRMSDLLPGAGCAGPDVFLADLAAIRAAAAAGFDPVLYFAVRDVLPPRVSFPVSSDDGPEGLKLSADLVIYQDGVLPGGEPFRSIGHWNPAGQLEIFQVLSGRVLMLTSGISIGGRPFARYQECRVGDVAVVPFGAWHLTYALDGPAIVFNIYTSPCGGAGPPQGGKGEPAGMAKYHSERGPAQIAAAREDGGLRFVMGPEASWSGRPAAVSCPAWLRVFLPAGASLPGWCVQASDAELRELEAAARVAAGSGWPS
jgi:hypothetical protein